MVRWRSRCVGGTRSEGGVELGLEEGGVEVGEVASDDLICDCAIKQEVGWCGGRQ